MALQSVPADFIPASQARVERLFSISGHISSQQNFRTNDRNFENVLFASVNYDIFETELRKHKQPDSDGVKICQNTVPLR